MVYLIGGAPRVGKSILGQRIATKLKTSWISTDILWQLLKAKNIEGSNIQWDASPEAIRKNAEWFYPCLKQFVWGVDSKAENYLIEGVVILPEQVAALSEIYPVRAVFLGCSQMTLEIFDRYPGRSRGYAVLPEEIRRQFAGDIPQWSRFVRQEAERYGYPYVDTAVEFPARLDEAEGLLTGSVNF